MFLKFKTITKGIMNKFDPKKVISIAEFFYNSVSCHFPKILGTKNKPFPNKKKPIVTSG